MRAKIGFFTHDAFMLLKFDSTKSLIKKQIHYICRLVNEQTIVSFYY
jgi:hypothetical protein